VNKTKAMRRHARVRALERAGIEMGRATRLEIVGAIRAGQSTFVRRQSLRVSVHDVVLADGPKVRVVYDKTRTEIVTVLPPPG